MATLDRIRVLDLGHYVAGPLTAQLLAQQGAEVVRVDRPGAIDGLADAYLQRNKQRISLDLKRPADVETARSLAADCDVVIENFRPGVLDRIGLSAEVLMAENPGLIYCSIPGFAAADPRSQVQGWEGVIDAATGNCRVRVGEAPPDWDFTRPTFSALPLASNFAAILSATAIVAALTEREVTGRGARLEVPLFDSMFELIGGAGAYSAERGFQSEAPLIANGSGTYECADGTFVQFNPIGATMRFLIWFLDAAGKQDWIAEGLGLASSYTADPELAAALRVRLAALFLTRPAQEWEELGQEAGVPLCMVRSSREWMENDHARASGQVVEVTDPEFGRTWMAGVPIHLSESPSVAPTPRHAVDADRSIVLDALAQRGGAVANSGQARAPKQMKDVRVVDLTQILAGPSAGRMLAEYGADVIKVNAPQRNIEAHGIVNRGKRSILIDLQRSEGQALLWELIDRADVVTQNFPQGTAERYGLGYRHVHARRPDIVFVSVSCYGYDGPWAQGRGYEVQGQAVTGIMERAGRGGKPAVLGPYNPLDYGTGAMAAFAATLGLFHRARTGQGQHVSTSLAQVGTFHQATMLVGNAGSDGEAAGRDALGASPLQRFYQASDGWFFLGARTEQLEAIVAVSRVLPDGSISFEEGLEAAFIAKDVAHWVRSLRDGGVGAHEIVRLPDLLLDRYVVDSGLRVEQVSEEVGPVIMPGPAVIIDGRRISAGRPANAPGADAQSVLDEIGRGDELSSLESRWVVQRVALPSGWPKP
ncbi:CaiB/BaiF CoA transferase family protein [Lacisediminihabitans profunda]|uniref:CoA transferase n=1 Tax=Lacisediminihabitans profunda TaxID=2594790 RepID=A0A5C8URL9_9MICO|nr:CoA transferase [Lacisediminihabitans profunda]TXN30942.1 CoA transferase [Lacisediminihabitans profunda]